MNDTHAPQSELITIDLDQAEPPHVESRDEASYQRAADNLLPIVE